MSAESFLGRLALYSDPQNGTVHGTDKLTAHSYGEMYEEVIHSIRAREALVVFENGTNSGAFAQFLAVELPQATVVAMDITLDNVCFGREQDNVVFIQCDGTRAASAERVASRFGFADLIIEDASHQPAHQLTSFDVFAPYLKPGGIYVIEDIADQGIRGPLQALADKHGVHMEWLDLRHVKHRFDDVVAIFRRSAA